MFFAYLAVTFLVPIGVYLLIWPFARLANRLTALEEVAAKSTIPVSPASFLVT